MAAKAKKVELTEAFIDAWRRENSLWDVTSHHYKTNRKLSRLSWKDLRSYWDFIKGRRGRSVVTKTKFLITFISIYLIQ